MSIRQHLIVYSHINNYIEPIIIFSHFQTGDEMSKRAKFVFVTWVGPSVSVMKKAKMSTDKALMKDIIQVIFYYASIFYQYQNPVFE